ncbi:hypothetical protein [Kutzneria chonburiensis]|uniref:JAB domain-containing protein n=1 Tax=Kutzneria chonburiensis TaxID=1483604 RepID=A0ABV6MNT7_9PSEU|nr:hypothetical protein [Kutzneria chonburiensis]
MLTIPDPVWQLLLDRFATAPAGHEHVAYLDGIRHRDRDGTLQGFATTVVIPDAVTSPGNFTVPVDAMERAGEHFEALGVVRLAQVHTHGNDFVDHSHIDDRRAYSQRAGALSIVLPWHAAGRPTLWQSGIHLREPAGWRRVTGPRIDEIVRVLPGVIDLRRPLWTASPTDMKAISEAASDRSPTPARWRWPWSWHRRPRD